MTGNDDACRCGRRRDRGYKTCATCRDRINAYYQRVRKPRLEANRDAGLCRCGAAREPGSNWITCRKCRDGVAASNRKARAA